MATVFCSCLHLLLQLVAAKSNRFLQLLHLLLQLVAAYGKRFLELSASSSAAGGS
jgi:hypothetical protein